MTSSAPPPPVTLEPGTRLDRYELLCVLAHGGMANVWLARVQGKMGFQRLCAVKTILPNVADDASFKTMFLDEARIASRIEHPNVVHMTDVGEAQGIPYLVMDLVEGEPLHKLPRACEKRGIRIPLGVVLRILADACHGLHAAHELLDDDGQSLGVVHRDMSPQNILVSAAGVSKVIDFGVAKARDRTTGQTSVGTLKGKISFMPREQALGQDVDRRADTWALGAVLYYLLTGRPPFKGEHQLATLQMAMNGAAIPPLPSTFPMSLRMAVTRALAHEPGQRYQTALEMGEALETLMRKLGVVTTHAEVGSFVQQTLGEKLDARKQLVASALGEASNRERARSALTVPVDLDDPGESSAGSHDPGLVVVPTAVISAPGLEDSAGRSPIASLVDAAHEASTGGVSGTLPGAAPTKNNWPMLVAAAAAAFALVGVILIALSMRGRKDAATAAAAGSAGTATAAVAAAALGGQPPPEVDPLPPSTARAPASAPAASADTTGAATAAKAAKPSGTTVGAPAAPPARPAWQPPAAAPKPGAPGAAPTPVAAPAAAAPAKPKNGEDYGF